jgi:hypothetical protein
MQRPDAQMVRAACKFKDINKSDIEYSLALPFLYFADQEHLDLPWLQETPQLAKIVNEESLAVGPENWLFKEFVMLFKSRGVLSRHEFTYISREDDHPLSGAFELDPKIESIVSVWTWDQREEDAGPYSYIHTLWRIYDGGKDIQCQHGSFSLDPKYSRFKTDDMSEDETNEYWRICAESIGVFIQTVQAMHIWLKESDKHPVEVVPVKQNTKKTALNKDAPWRRATGPRILFLDRMPTTQTESTGTHASPKPHRRRGHWRELSHPRYRHHPQYKQKIWVKPSFIGPEQAVYEGNLYRLIKPLDEILAA